MMTVGNKLTMAATNIKLSSHTNLSTGSHIYQRGCTLHNERMTWLTWPGRICIRWVSGYTEIGWPDWPGQDGYVSGGRVAHQRYQRSGWARLPQERVVQQLSRARTLPGSQHVSHQPIKPGLIKVIKRTAYFRIFLIPDRVYHDNWQYCRAGDKNEVLFVKCEIRTSKNENLTDTLINYNKKNTGPDIQQFVSLNQVFM